MSLAHRVLLLCIACVLISSCSTGRTAGRADAEGAEDGRLSLSELHAIFDARIAADRSITSLEADGYFNYRDVAGHDLNLSITVRHDESAGFTRIVFLGNLAGDYYADIVINEGNVQMYFPLDKVVYTGTIENFNLYPLARINIQLSVLLNLALGRVYLIENYEKHRGAVSSDHYILNIKSNRELQQLFFDKESRLVSETKIFRIHNDSVRERATIKYANHRDVGGLALPFRTDLVSLYPNFSAVVWFRNVSRSYAFEPDHAVLEVPEGVRKQRI